MSSELRAFAFHQSRSGDSSFLFLYPNALRESCLCTRTGPGLKEEPQILSRGTINAYQAYPESVVWLKLSVLGRILKESGAEKQARMLTKPTLKNKRTTYRCLTLGFMS